MINNKNIPVLLYNCLARRNPYYKPDPGASTTSSSPAAGQSAQQSAAEPGMEIKRDNFFIISKKQLLHHIKSTHWKGIFGGWGSGWRPFFLFTKVSFFWANKQWTLRTGGHYSLTLVNFPPCDFDHFTPYFGQLSPLRLTLLPPVKWLLSPFSIISKITILSVFHKLLRSKELWIK